MVQKREANMHRVLSANAVTLLGVGALLGGGVFTILGSTIGFAGAVGAFLAILFLSVLLLGIVGMYAELGTAFPEAGGGYLWVREGLGDFQGFLSGWLSWFAHASACGLYALSFGFYVAILPGLLGLDVPLSERVVQISSSIVILAVFGFVNWRGVKTLSSTGNAITLIVLGILALFAVAGVHHFLTEPHAFRSVFSAPILPHGIGGILAAMSFFFIAFEGSEIQTQAAEEMKNPESDLPKALFSARAIVAVLYLLITLAVIGGFGAVSGGSAAIGAAGEHALPEAATQLFPGGAILIAIGGLLVNIAALNVTIFSSSHVILAMARARHVLQGLAEIHAKNRTPHRAVILSTIFVIALTILFPLAQVASIADFLFILLFLQAVFAFLALRQRRPDVVRPYRLAGSPWVPLFTAAMLILLGIILITRVSTLAGILGALWVFLGLLNYYAYSTPMEHAELEEKMISAHAWKTGQFPTYRVLVPVSRNENVAGMFEIGLALAKQREAAEVSLVRIDETPGDHRINREQEHAEIESLFATLAERGRNVHAGVSGSIIESDDPTRTMLGLIGLEHMNLLVVGWDGHARQGRIFSHKVDALLREARCDTIVVRLSDLHHMKRLLLCINPIGGRHVRYLARAARALRSYFSGTITAVTVLRAQDSSERFVKETRARLEHFLAREGLADVALQFLRGEDRAGAIVALEDQFDAILMGEGKARFLREFRLGSVSHQVMRRTKKTGIIVKGHIGILPPLWQYIRERL